MLNYEQLSLSARTHARYGSWSKTKQSDSTASHNVEKNAAIWSIDMKISVCSKEAK